MKERKEANERNDKSSSFYGDTGHWNYLNSMFDLFLAGSETTSTSLTWTLLYLIRFPSIQQKLQDELEQGAVNLEFYVEVQYA